MYVEVSVAMPRAERLRILSSVGREDFGNTLAKAFSGLLPGVDDLPCSAVRDVRIKLEKV